MKNFVLILAISSSFLMAEELPLLTEQRALPESNISVAKPDSGESPVSTPPQLNSIQYRKFCPYGALSLSSGAGVSWRSRNDFKGRSLDLKAGIGIATILSNRYQTISLDYNWFTFFRPTESSPYFSWGVGGSILFQEDWKQAGFLPSVPLRLGYQFKYGFMDAGVKLFGLLPVPEWRAGMSFDF